MLVDSYVEKLPRVGSGFGKGTRAWDVKVLREAGVGARDVHTSPHDDVTRNSRRGDVV